jgi:hypothetical protein
VKGFELGPHEPLAFALANLHGLLDPQKLLGCALEFNASRLQEEHKAGRTAVQDGYFVGADVDVKVVKAQPSASRQQVLDGLHLGAAGVTARADGGGHAGVADRAWVDRDVNGLSQIGAPKDDAGVFWRWAEHQFHFAATVDAHPYGACQ